MVYDKIMETLEKVKSEKCGTKAWLIKLGHNGEYNLTEQRVGKLGSFFNGNCYLIVQIMKPDNRLRRNAYLWIGSEVEKDGADGLFEATFDATRKLGGTIFHKECQNNESREFLDLFPCGIRYFKGTSQSYHHFDKGTYVKRLFQIKGRRHVQVIEVPMSYTMMNSGDSYVLDDEWTIYCWNGKYSNRAEKTKALEVARAIRDELCYGKAEIVVADQGEDSSQECRFFQALGNRGPIKCPEKGGDDDEFEMNKQGKGITLNVKKAIRKVHRHSTEEKVYEIDNTSFTLLKRKDLHSHTSYLFDIGYAQLFVWIGKDCEADIFESVQGYTREQKIEDAHITFLMEDYENESFQNIFDEWSESNLHQHKQLVEIENDEEAEEKEEEEEYEKNDDDSGPIKIWLVDGYRRLLWPFSWYGYFFNNECYIIEQLDNDKHQHTLYIWQGKDSSYEERKASFEMAQQFDKELNYQSTILKLTDGKEVDQFLKIMKGQFTVLQNEDLRTLNTQFYRIQGDEKHLLKTTQISVDSQHLNSQDTFLLKMKDKSILWNGKMTGQHQQDLAEQKADKLAPYGDLYIISEGHELPWFWDVLGRAPKHRENEEETEDDSAQTRLFRYSVQTGRTKIDEILPIDQNEMNGNDVMILDANDKVFLWCGENANSSEKEAAWEVAKDFITISGRDPNTTTICQEKQGFESANFKNYFKTWDPELKLGSVSYTNLKKQIDAENKKAKEKALKRAYQQKKHKTKSVGDRDLNRVQYH